MGRCGAGPDPRRVQTSLLGTSPRFVLALPIERRQAQGLADSLDTDVEVAAYQVVALLDLDQASAGARASALRDTVLIQKVPLETVGLALDGFH